MSFLFGLLVLASQDASLVKRCVFYVLNSLVIFVVAVGSNTVGRVASDPEARSAASAIEQPGTAIGGFFISSAVAQTTDKTWCCVGDKTNPTSREECSKWNGKSFSTEDAAKRACTAPRLSNEPDKGKGFFREWVRVSAQTKG